MVWAEHLLGQVLTDRIEELRNTQNSELRNLMMLKEPKTGGAESRIHYSAFKFTLVSDVSLRMLLSEIQRAGRFILE